MVSAIILANEMKYILAALKYKYNPKLSMKKLRKLTSQCLSEMWKKKEEGHVRRNVWKKPNEAYMRKWKWESLALNVMPNTERKNSSEMTWNWRNACGVIWLIIS